ncbi:MAG: methylmalonyl-CoA mutase family protein, partial [Bacteroidia bacterium]
MQNILDTFSPVSSEEWMKQIEKELKGKNPEILNWKISENIILKPFYLADKPCVSKFKEKVSLSQQREICEYIHALHPETANKKSLKALMQGANALNFNCINADISSDYFEQLLNEIQWQYIQIHFTINQGVEFVQTLNEWCNKKKINTSDLKGSICFDIYHRELVKGIAADEKDFELFIISANKYFPSLNNICVNATSYLNAGANVIQELAYTCAHVSEYLNLLSNKSLLKQISSIQIQLAIGSNYLVEIAKLRAVRLLLASIFEKFSLQVEVNIHAFTATINKSHKDAYNNMLRATTEAMSAIIGGANQISVMPYDEIGAQTSQFSERIARNITLILSEESYLDKVIDPAAGSYLIEKLTRELAEKSWEKFCTIENKGGWKALLQNGEMIIDIERNAEKLIDEYRNNK